MKQAAFEHAYAKDWQLFEDMLDASRRADRGAKPAGDYPRLYRRICQHLALARDRAYAPELVDRLNALALRGHHRLYGTQGLSGNRLADFYLRQFPRCVRDERLLVSFAIALFFGPLLAIGIAIQIEPDLAYYVLDPRQMAAFQEMYDPANPRPGFREADSNVMMFAFYIWNNVRIGFQTFAGGLLFGLGTVFYLVFNGVQIGAVAGHLTQAGFGGPFWSFVSGHSASELTAIVLSGAAGLRLGAALVAPGRLTRRSALRAAAGSAIRLVYGAATLFTLAAFIEAFWSPIGAMPALLKHTAGLAMWAALLAYLGLAGRSRAA
jgi:uncharacterized membrane protein SpoIIM required for sporulation